MMLTRRRSTLAAMIAGIAFMALSFGTVTADHIHGGMPGSERAPQSDETSCGVDLEKLLSTTETIVIEYPFN